MTPNLAFKFCYPCALLWILPPSKLVCLFSLEHILFLLLYFSCFLSFPTVGLSFLHHCLWESHPSFKGRRCWYWLSTFHGPSTFHILFYWISRILILWVTYYPHFRRFRKVINLPEVTNLKSGKVGLWDFFFFKVGCTTSVEPSEGPELRSWLKSPWPIHHVHQAAS